MAMTGGRLAQSRLSLGPPSSSALRSAIMQLCDPSALVQLRESISCRMWGAVGIREVAVVRRVLYLIFNEGYSRRVDLSAEAIRLTRQLALACDEPEVAGLLALMLVHHARRAARTDEHGTLIPLDKQDGPDTSTSPPSTAPARQLGRVAPPNGTTSPSKRPDCAAGNRSGWCR
jgi:hypothetical protein